MHKLSIKNGNRILCAVTVLMVCLPYGLAFIGLYDTLIVLVISQLAIIAIVVAGSLLGGVDPFEAYRFKAINLRTMVFAFLMVLCCFPIVSLLNVLSMFFVENAVLGTASDIYRYGLKNSILIMAVLPAIGEELFVRGVIYHSYREKSPILAWILSALIFGMLHMNFNQMPYAIFLGIIMVLMMEASDSIVTSMCMHFFVNGISTLSGYFSALEMDMMAEEGITVESMLGTGEMMRAALMGLIMLALIMIPLILLFLFGTCRINGRSFREAFRKPEPIYERYTLPEEQEEDRIIDIWFVNAVLIMVVITGLNTFA